MASGYLDVMATLGGDVVAERQIYVKLLQGSMFGTMADAEFAQYLHDKPPWRVPPPSVQVPASFNRIAVASSTESLIPKDFKILMINDGILGNGGAASNPAAALAAH